MVFCQGTSGKPPPGPVGPVGYGFVLAFYPMSHFSRVLRSIHPEPVGLVMEDMSFLKVGLGDERQPIEVDGRVSWWILLGRVGLLRVD